MQEKEIRFRGIQRFVLIPDGSVFGSAKAREMGYVL